MAEQVPEQKKITAEQIIERIDKLADAVNKHEVPEMPYSWNLKATNADGFEEQFTVRKIEGVDYFDSVVKVREWVKAQGYKPTNGGSKNQVAPDAGEQIPICGIHNKPMTKRNRKDGSGTFWSCGEKLADGTWCPYKPPKK